MSKPTIDHQDVTLSIATPTDLVDLSLVQAVAAGRLFIQNNRGEFEQVTLATYWRDDDSPFGQGLYTVSATNQTEYDESGETTRDFRGL
jgi:hypothetical protein